MVSQFSSPLPREGVISVPRSFTCLVFLEFLQGFLLSIPLHSVPRGRRVHEVSRVFMCASHVFTETAPIEGPWFNDLLKIPFQDGASPTSNYLFFLGSFQTRSPSSLVWRSPKPTSKSPVVGRPSSKLQINGDCTNKDEELLKIR